MTAALAAAGWAAAVAAWQARVRREQLVARAAHELRGPLTALRLGLVAIARHGGPSAARAAALDSEIDRARLALDDLAGRDAGEGGELVDLAAVVHDVAIAWEPVARALGTQIVAPACEPAIVRGERTRLAQAVGNLVANALEHGQGAVRLSLARREGRIALEVRDDGPGLPAPVEALLRRGGRGARGHGLAIASDVARRHGGRLAAAPSGAGSRLVLDLPART